MKQSPNPYCQALEIEVPTLEAAKNRADANYYGLLIVALLEKGAPLTLHEAAERFARAGIAPADRALKSLKRCKPGRAPIYRDGELYALDPHDQETDLWVFRLGLRPPRAPFRGIVGPPPGPLPSLDRPLTRAQLDEAWRAGPPWNWSAQRLAICVLDAHGQPMAPGDVVAFVDARGKGHQLRERSARYWRRGAPIRAGDDGRWELDPVHPAVRSARLAVRDRIESVRRWADAQPDPKIIAANRKHYERQRETHARELAAMRRVLIHAFPAASPQAVVLIDINQHDITSYVGTEIATAVRRLADYDLIVAVDVRGVLRALGFEPGRRRLAELGPPQKSRTLNRAGRTLKITQKLLIQGSCGISQPLGDPRKLREYLRTGNLSRLRRRLEADAKSLHALYQYGRLHGCVRLRWGFLDERIPAPWVHIDEPKLRHLFREALEQDQTLEVVAGNAPGWADPWSRRERVRVRQSEDGWTYWLTGDSGRLIYEEEVQLARLVTG